MTTTHSILQSDISSNALDELSFEQIEREISKEFIYHAGQRRLFSSLAEERIANTHRDLITRNANIHRRATPFVYALVETALKTCDVATVIAPQEFPKLFESLKGLTGFEVMSLDRFVDTTTGEKDLNKVADACGKITTFGTSALQSIKHVHDNITSGEKTELKGYEDRARSHSEFKRQELMRMINEELQALQKLEQSRDRSYNAKRAIIGH